MLSINFLFILRKSVNFSVILSSKRKMNSTIVCHQDTILPTIPTAPGLNIQSNAGDTRSTSLYQKLA